MTAIDFNGTSSALKLDLNFPLNLPHAFDAVLNLGTAEHVFNICQVFKSVHEYTRPQGLMIHGMPFTGFVDHGFYNFNPTFYWDLAEANGYSALLYFYAELTPPKIWQLQGRESLHKLIKEGTIGKQSSLIYAVWRMPASKEPFRMPRQGFYARTLSKEAENAWMEMR